MCLNSSQFFTAAAKKPAAKKLQRPVDSDASDDDFESKPKVKAAGKAKAPKPVSVKDEMASLAALLAPTMTSLPASKPANTSQPKPKAAPKPKTVKPVKKQLSDDESDGDMPAPVAGTHSLAMSWYSDVQSLRL